MSKEPSSQPSAILESYRGFDILPEKTFSDFTRLAASVCETPLAAICLVHGKRQWFKAFFGTSGQSLTRLPFCASEFLQAGTILEAPDARIDPRFEADPLVRGEAGLVFYAGAPLVAEDGLVPGVLCVLDRESRSLRLHQLDALRILASQIMEQSRLQQDFSEAVDLLDEHHEFKTHSAEFPSTLATIL